jgi:hypothetical protein
MAWGYFFEVDNNHIAYLLVGPFFIMDSYLCTYVLINEESDMVGKLRCLAY